MLTKQERETIAKRLWNYHEEDYYEFYQALTGEETTKNTPLEEDCDKMANIIFDLCDTSNMIELPLDKDGKVIKIGDEVRDGFGRHLVVVGMNYTISGNVLVDGLDDTEGIIYSDHSSSLFHE
jgi:transcriptional regulator of heat shock response